MLTDRCYYRFTYTMNIEANIDIDTHDDFKKASLSST